MGTSPSNTMWRGTACIHSKTLPDNLQKLQRNIFHFLSMHVYLIVQYTYEELKRSPSEPESQFMWSHKKQTCNTMQLLHNLFLCISSTMLYFRTHPSSPAAKKEIHHFHMFKSQSCFKPNRFQVQHSSAKQTNQPRAYSNMNNIVNIFYYCNSLWSHD